MNGSTFLTVAALLLTGASLAFSAPYIVESRSAGCGSATQPGLDSTYRFDIYEDNGTPSPADDRWIRSFGWGCDRVIWYGSSGPSNTRAIGVIHFADGSRFDSHDFESDDGRFGYHWARLAQQTQTLMRAGREDLIEWNSSQSRMIGTIHRNDSVPTIEHLRHAPTANSAPRKRYPLAESCASTAEFHRVQMAKQVQRPILANRRDLIVWNAPISLGHLAPPLDQQ